MGGFFKFRPVVMRKIARICSKGKVRTIFYPHKSDLQGSKMTHFAFYLSSQWVHTPCSNPIRAKSEKRGFHFLNIYTVINYKVFCKEGARGRRNFFLKKVFTLANSLIKGFFVKGERERGETFCKKISPLANLLKTNSAS